MPINDQANDRYNPPSNLSRDFEEVNLSDLEESDLFWLKDGGIDNPPYRKFDNNEGGNIKTRMIESFDPNQTVYQRT